MYNYYQKNYGGLNTLFCNFDIYDEYEDEEIIKIFCKEDFLNYGIKKKEGLIDDAIKEGKALLALPDEEFPDEWIDDLTGGRVTYPNNKDWVAWMVEQLEKEKAKLEAEVKAKSERA